MTCTAKYYNEGLCMEQHGMECIEEKCEEWKTETKAKPNWGLDLQLQAPKHLHALIRKYGQDKFDCAFATEMQLHADEVSREQIEKIIKNNEEDGE